MHQNAEVEEQMAVHDVGKTMKNQLRFGLVVKLGLQCFMHEYADAASELAASAYADLMRLTGYDPAAEILAKLQ